MAPTAVLITGANRGLGKGLVERYLAKPEHTVIAGTRNPDSESSKALLSIPKGDNSRLVVVKIEVDAAGDHAEAVKTLEKKGIGSLDLVIASAGISDEHPFVNEVKMSDLQRHIDTNVFGVLYLYQATLPLLKKSPSPKWITIGSSAGSIEAQPPHPNSAYGPTKTMLHWYTKRINAEQESLTDFVVDPGFVASDLGNFAARKLGLERAPVDIKDSVDGMTSVIDAATKETHGGKFISFQGESQPW